MKEIVTDGFLISFRQIDAMNTEIAQYNGNLDPEDRKIANRLAEIVDTNLDAESKIWHAHPVWFIDGNPIVGYSKLKDSVRLLFWSGQSFREPGLHPEGKFKAAETRFTSVDDIDETKVKKWLKESVDIQWDYKNIVKRKGELLRLK